jgi:excisionase family DNA binding protein
MDLHEVLEMAVTDTIELEESVRRMTPIAAPREQRASVLALMELLHHVDARHSGAETYRLISPTGKEVAIPESVFVLLERITEVLARGDAITVAPVGKELTTQQAANILNVSRQYLVRLLDDGRIPFRRTGTHRRVRMEDVLAFQRQRDRDRMASLDDLSKLSQEFGGYEELSGDD